MSRNICESNECYLPIVRLTDMAESILQQRYLIRDEERNIIETPEQMFHRVAKTIAQGDVELEAKFYTLMTNLDFLPNSPTLMNAGTELGQLSACFVIPIEDDLKSIMQGVMDAAMIHKSGGGTGFSFSRLRPQGDVVKKTGGVASGPISFMTVYNAATEVIKQGGKRRGANMGILRVDHPDIFDFLVLKEKEGVLSNFNLSVAVTDKFMKAMKENLDFDLINPKNGRVYRTVKARAIWNLLTAMTWKNGEPACIFIDTINRENNLLESLGPMESTNPCAEQPLYPYESCNLGSINLANHVREGDGVNWVKLKETVRLAVEFLDNVINVNQYPLEQIDSITKSNRKIGLGVMGFADMLIKMKIKYNEEKAEELAKKVMKFITDEARQRSVELGELKGDFPNFQKSRLAKDYPHMRNATVTTIAPTGTLSMIAGVSFGIEPLFDMTLKKDLSDTIGEKFEIKHPLYDGTNGEFFITALQLKPEDHIRIQAAFQQYTDNAVSKTINFPNNATPEDVERAYLLAYKKGCKGVAMYRNGSRDKQIIEMTEEM